ncbi:MAG: hypothetical protein U9N18_06355, partial [Campylobacterota bacterium]|nr:hypothetical protein [Campylobacterota bacterium]
MEKNIFQILGVQTKEDVVSNALVHGLNSSKSFLYIFLETVCKKDPRKYSKCTGYTRLSTATSGIPDIVLTCYQKNNDVDLVVIENKLKADEGEDQTERYASQESIDSLIKILGLKKSQVFPSFVFLTLFPDQSPKSKYFKSSTYLELSNGLNKLSRGVDAVAEQLIDDWNELLSRFYQCRSINHDDIATNKLSGTDNLDGGYLYFRSMLSELTFPPGLEVEDCFRSSRQGRRFYGAVISKDDWHPTEMSEVNGKWQLNGGSDYNIHFEPQYNVLNGIFNLFIHYEVNPYETEKWVLKNIKFNQYNHYKAVRESFIQDLEARNVKGLIFGGGSNQIAKASFNFQDKSTSEIQTMLQDFMGKVSHEIDFV